MDKVEGIPVGVLKRDWNDVRSVVLHGGGPDLGEYEDISEERRIGHAQSYKRMKFEFNQLGEAIRLGKTEEFLADKKNWVSMKPVEPSEK